MIKNHNARDKEVSVKSTKEQILAAYNEVLTKLTDKQIATPQEQKKQEKEEVVGEEKKKQQRQSTFVSQARFLAINRISLKNTFS